MPVLALLTNLTRHLITIYYHLTVTQPLPDRQQMATDRQLVRR
jgi:hypothetical protein